MPLFPIAADLVALAVLVFVLFPLRSGRRELIPAYLVVNVGVLAVTATLSTSTISAGLGLGLFGILSIIRLRSEEISQREIAYYFAGLTLGLLGGIATTPVWAGPALMAAVLVAVAVGDLPRISPATKTQELLLDRAVVDPAAARAQVEALLGVEVLDIDLARVDLVNDTTSVRIRYRGQVNAQPQALRVVPGREIAQ